MPVKSNRDTYHDFGGKLAQPGMRSVVGDYIKWRRGEMDHDEWIKLATPLSINLDLTTACNYACDHCIDWDSLNSPIRHDMVVLRDSLKELAGRGMRSVILIGGGEPTLHPEFSETIRFLKQELNQQVAVVSNGSRNDVIAGAASYMSTGDWVRLSLDSGTNATFQAMHRPKNNLSLESICISAADIKQANPDITLGFSFIITWNGAHRDDVEVIANIDEMESAAQIALEHGFDYITFKPFLSRTVEGTEIMDVAQAQTQSDALAKIGEGLEAARALEQDQSGFRVLESTNLRVLLDGSWRELTKQPRVCHMQALRQVVSPLGVFNCPAYRGVERARIGNAGAWAGVPGVEPPAARATAAILDRFDASCECSEVTCLYNSTNLMLQDLIDNGGSMAEVEAVAKADFFL